MIKNNATPTEVLRDGADDSQRAQTETADTTAKEILTKTANTDETDGNMQDNADDAKIVSSALSDQSDARK